MFGACPPALGRDYTVELSQRSLRISTVGASIEPLTNMADLPQKHIKPLILLSLLL